MKANKTGQVVIDGNDWVEIRFDPIEEMWSVCSSNRSKFPDYFESESSAKKNFEKRCEKIIGQTPARIKEKNGENSE